MSAIRPGVRVTIFPLDLVNPLVFSSESNNSTTEISVVTAMTQNRMGAPNSPFKVTLKGRLGQLRSLEAALKDDDWCGIEFMRNDRAFATMLGPIASIGLKEGPYPSAELVLYGNQFGSIFSRTQAFFDQMVDRLLYNDAIRTVFEAAGSNPADAVGTWLWGYLSTALGTVAKPPNKMPVSLAAFYSNSLLQTKPGASISDLLSYRDFEFYNDPFRSQAIAVSHPDSIVGHSVWDLAQTWSDEPMCELFCDLMTNISNKRENAKGNVEPVPPTDPLRGLGLVSRVPPSGTRLSLLLAEGRGLQMQYWASSGLEPEAQPLSSSFPAVIFRNRPFITSSSSVSTYPTFWRRIPHPKISSSEIQAKDLVRSGAERVNAVYLTVSSPGSMGISMRCGGALNQKSIRRHGFKRANPNCKFLLGHEANDSNQSSTVATPEAILAYQGVYRDFHCMNHLLYSGTIPLLSLRPDIRIGSEVQQVVDNVVIARYYIEEVVNQYQYGKATTTLGVTRGWNGADTREQVLENQKAQWVVVEAGGIPKSNIDDTGGD